MEKSYIYLTPRIGALEPDFLLIDVQRGVLIFETKDWTADYLATINPKEVVAIDAKKYYNPTAINWNQDIGLDMRGRSKIFKQSYRAGKEHLAFSLKYLMEDSSLKKEVEKFYEGSEEIESKTKTVNSLVFVEGQFQEVIRQVNSLLNEGYIYSDILILANTWKEAKRFYAYLPPYLKEKSKVSKDVEEGIMNITTYHSSKGLENKISFLLNVDTIHEKKLLYVGTTRASEKLYIHSTSFSRGVGQSLKNLVSLDYELSSL